MFVEFDGAMVGEGDVEEGGDVLGAMLEGEVGDKGLRIAETGMGGGGADGAELGVAGEAHAFAGHGYEAVFVWGPGGLLGGLLTDAEVGAEEVGIWAVVAGLDAGDEVVHFLAVCFVEGFYRVDGRLDIGGWGEKHLGAGELEFEGPVFGERGELVDEVESFVRFYIWVELGEGRVVFAGDEREDAGAVAEGPGGAFGEGGVVGGEGGPGGKVQYWLHICLR